MFKDMFEDWKSLNHFYISSSIRNYDGYEYYISDRAFFKHKI